jgi:hypothetical protein
MLGYQATRLFLRGSYRINQPMMIGDACRTYAPIPVNAKVCKAGVDTIKQAEQ